MVNIFDVAKHFTSIELMEHKKLQKLCYYAQCWYCGLNNKDKFMDTDFEAWIHGPVSPILYSEYKKYGWQEIPKTESPNSLELNIKEFLNSVYNLYGKFSGDELEILTHSEMPWKKARGSLPPTESCRNIINIDDMYIFCKEKLQESYA